MKCSPEKLPHYFAFVILLKVLTCSFLMATRPPSFAQQLATFILHHFKAHRSRE